MTRPGLVGPARWAAQPALVRSTHAYLVGDPLADRRAVDLSSSVLRNLAEPGLADPTILARIRVLRSVLGWAHDERVPARRPRDGMRGPLAALR